MDLKPLAGIYNNWYGKLNNKERRLFFFLVVVLAGSFYFTLFLKPAWDDISRLKKQLQDNQNQLGLLKSQIPAFSKAKQETEKIKQNIKTLGLKVSDVESKLIGPSQEQQLLTEVIKNAQSLGVDLESVNESIKEEREGFARLYIDLKFSSNYKKVIAYTRIIESISPFVKLEGMSLSQSKNEPVSTVEASLRISALLSYASNNRGQLSPPAKAAGADIEGINRSPFTPRFIADKTRKKLKVTGITYRGDATGSTAIINGTIARVGDQVEGAKVERILSDSVTIDNGVEKEILKLER